MIHQEEVDAILRSLEGRTAVLKILDHTAFELADGATFLTLSLKIRSPEEESPPDLGIHVGDGVGVGEIVMGQEVEKE